MTVLITGAGAPGIAGTIYSLRNNYDDRKIRIIGVDLRENAVGRFMMDGFHRVPRPDDEGLFLERLLEICKAEGVDAILPQVTLELEVFAKNRGLFSERGIQIAVNDFEEIRIANNKFELTKVAEALQCGAPDYRLVKSLDDLEIALEAFGYPEKPIVFKPPVSMGMRGLRIIDEKRDKFSLWAKEKPTGVYVTKEEFLSIFKGRDLPELVALEYLPGPEYTVDILADKGKPIVTIPRERVQIRSGITFHGVLKKHDEIIDYSNRLTERLRLNYIFGFQFKLNREGEAKILECNPRIQGTMVAATLAGANIIYSALKMLFDEELPDFELDWNHEFMRYWGGLGISNEIATSKL